MFLWLSRWWLRIRHPLLVYTVNGIEWRSMLDSKDPEAYDLGVMKLRHQDRMRRHNLYRGLGSIIEEQLLHEPRILTPERLAAWREQREITAKIIRLENERLNAISSIAPGIAPVAAPATL